MKAMARTVLAAVLLSLAVVPTRAQPAQGQRVVGAIEAVDGRTLTVKTKDGQVKVNLADNARVFGVVKATLADIKPGAYIGVGATPQPDGSQKAIRVMIFSEPQRGTGEGHRPWIHPGSTMTNATVETTVAGVDGQTVTVKYKGGEKKIIIPSDLAIQRYVPGDRSELKAGAPILIVRAERKADGTLEADRVNVGRDGVIPQ